LFAEGLGVGFAVGVEEVFAAFFPCGFHFWCGDVPVGAAFLCDGAEIVAEIFHGGAAEVPVAVVDLVNDEAGLENDDVRDHRIVVGVSVFGDVEVLLDVAGRVGEEGPVSADAGAVLICDCDVVSADGDEPAVADFHFAVELDEVFGLAAVLGAEASAAEDEDHGMLALKVGELAAFGGVIGEFVVGEGRAGDDVGSHDLEGTRKQGQGTGTSYQFSVISFRISKPSFIAGNPGRFDPV
jgi:hypothetical protein